MIELNDHQGGLKQINYHIPKGGKSVSDLVISNTDVEVKAE